MLPYFCNADPCEDTACDRGVLGSSTIYRLKRGIFASRCCIQSLTGQLRKEKQIEWLPGALCISGFPMLFSHKSGQSPVFVVFLQDRIITIKKKQQQRLSSILTCYDVFFQMERKCSNVTIQVYTAQSTFLPLVMFFHGYICRAFKNTVLICGIVRYTSVFALITPLHGMS